MGLSDSPLCRRCGAEDQTSAHILCECEALASLRHVYLGSFCLEPEDIKGISVGAIWSFSKATDMGHKGHHHLRPRWIRIVRSSTKSQINQSISLTFI